MVYGWLSLLIGAGYGYFKKGKQDKSELFKTGFLWGLIIAVVLAAIGALTGGSALGLGRGFIGIILSVLIILVLFVLGVWLGDLIEEKT